MHVRLSETARELRAQLGRPPRGVLEVAYCSPDGQPGVVKTAPRLEDGTPFPTLYYLTDPRTPRRVGRGPRGS